MSWQVRINSQIVKRLRDRRRLPAAVEVATLALVAELQASGPAVNWPNYGKLRHQ